jgi:hypothetical protein
VNSGPLSVCREEGILNWGMISLIRKEAMVEALLLVVGKDSTHPEKVSTNIIKYLNFFTGGMWEKSSCQSAAGRETLA